MNEIGVRADVQENDINSDSIEKEDKNKDKSFDAIFPAEQPSHDVDEQPFHMCDKKCTL